MSNSPLIDGSSAMHSIRVASKLTGVNQHVIRIWEKRYKAVQPERTRTNRRLYSENDLDRLRLLRMLTEAGHSIGTVAGHSTERLRSLLSNPSNIPAQLHAAPILSLMTSEGPGADPVERCMDAIRRLDAAALDRILNLSLLQLGHHGVLMRVAAPLVHRVGEAWQSGDITAAHEHFASSQLKVFLATTHKVFAAHPSAPGLAVATPAGQHHELGASLVAAAALNCGWRVTFLGANLPSPEIARAVIQNRCRAVALSIVYPADDPELPVELRRLRQFLPQPTQIITGGRSASSYESALKEIGALRFDDLPHLCHWLTQSAHPA